MDEHGAHANLGRHLQGPLQRVHEQAGADPNSLIRSVDGKPAQDHDRDGVGQPMPNLTRDSPTGDASRRKTVIADDAPVVLDDVGSRRSTFAFDRPLTQPVVQELVAAVEPAKIIVGADRLRWREGQGVLPEGLRLPRCLASEQSLELLIGRRRIVEDRHESCEAASIERKESLIQEHVHGALAGAFNNELAARFSRRLRGVVDQLPGLPRKTHIDHRVPLGAGGSILTAC